MALLDRISPERRRKTGVVIPVVVLAAIMLFTPGPDVAVDRRDQLWMAGLTAVGIVTGALWQWYSPRNLGDRLIVPASGVIALPIIAVIAAGEMSYSAWILQAGLGVVAGVVVGDRWQRIREGREAPSSADR
jgi:hypothetical protein